MVNRQTTALAHGQFHLHRIQHFERHYDARPGITRLLQESHVKTGVMKYPYTSPCCFKQGFKTHFQRHTPGHILIQQFMDRGTVSDRLPRIDKKVPVRRHAYATVIQLCPANGDDLILCGIQAGHFEINRNEWRVSQLVHTEFGTIGNISRHTGLCAILRQRLTPSAITPTAEHQCTWYLKASAFWASSTNINAALRLRLSKGERSSTGTKFVGFSPAIIWADW